MSSNSAQGRPANSNGNLTPALPRHQINEAFRNSGVGGDAWSGLLVDGSDSDSDSDDDFPVRRQAPKSSSSTQSPQQGRTPSSTGNASTLPHSSGTTPVSPNTDVQSPRAPRESWTTRAAAVGSRPPDTASQNPPSLKLLGLKSLKEGGHLGAGIASPRSPSALSATSNGNSSVPPLSPAMSMRREIEQRQQREQSMQNRADAESQARRQAAEAQRRNYQSPAQQGPMPGQQQMIGRHQHERPPARSETAASNTTGFELVSSPRADGSAFSSPHDNDTRAKINQQELSNSKDAEEIKFRGSETFGGVSSHSSNRDHHRNLSSESPHFGFESPRGFQLHDGPVPEPSPIASPQGSAFQSNSDHNVNSRRALAHELGLQSQSSDGSLDSHKWTASPEPLPQSGTQANHNSSHSDGPQGHSIFEQQQRQMSSQFKNAPSPSSQRSLLSSSRERPAQNGAFAQQSQSGTQQHPADISLQRGNLPPPMPVAIPTPVAVPQQVPAHARPRQMGFSDAQHGPQQNGNRQSMFRRSMAFFRGPSLDEPQGAPRHAQGGPQRRPSLFRRSMAKLTGRGPIAGNPQVIDSNMPGTPQPRVQGFLDEKPRERKSTYLGGGGMGDEWDVNGYGARFWKRFSHAQRMQETGAFHDMDATRRRVEKRRKITLYGSLLGCVLIIAAIVAVVVWREKVKTSAVPPTLGKGNPNANAAVSTKSASNTSASQTSSAAQSSSTDTSSAKANADDSDSSTTASSSSKSSKSSTSKADKEDKSTSRDSTKKSDKFSNESDGNSKRAFTEPSLDAIQRSVDGVFPRARPQDALVDSARRENSEKLAPALHEHKRFVLRRRKALDGLV